MYFTYITLILSSTDAKFLNVVAFRSCNFSVLFTNGGAKEMTKFLKIIQRIP